MIQISPLKIIALVLLAFFAVMNSFAEDTAQDSALRFAALEGKTKEVTSLLKSGANPNGEGTFGETALMSAARYNQPKTALLLLQAGADPEQRDTKDQTALMTASRHCSPRVGKQVIAARANVNWQDLHGRTALMYAAATGCFQIVDMLLKANGVDVNIKDDEGFTALDLVMEEKSLEVGGPYTDIHQMLLKVGAKHSRWIDVSKSTHPNTAPKPQFEQQPVKLR